MTRPPIDSVPVFTRCPDCGNNFRGRTSWAGHRPRYTRNRCPWCGASVLIDREPS